MNIGAVIAATLMVLLLVPAQLSAQAETNSKSPELRNGQHAATLHSHRNQAEAPIIDEIEFVGLRRISPEALKTKIGSHAGEEFEAQRIERDVRTLARLGWFDSVRVGAEDAGVGSAPAHDGGNLRHMRLVFNAPELPFLTGVEYRGSRLLSRQQIDKLLTDKTLTPKTGEPENRVTLQRAARELELALQELGHLDAHVSIKEAVSANHTVRVHFEISDGPRLIVGRVAFIGNRQVSGTTLRHAMRRITPGTLLSGLCGRNAYTREAYEEDREHLLSYYQNHGYPEARVGSAQISRYEVSAWHWLLGPGKRDTVRLSLSIPIEAGPFYMIASVQTSAELQNAAASHQQRLPNYESLLGQPYSAQTLENLRRSYQSVLSAQARHAASAKPLNVEAVPFPDAATHTVHIVVRPSTTPAYIVRHLEFTGTRRFSDQYLRRRVPLKEGAAFDDHAIEAGLARLSRTVYFKPIKKEEIHVTSNDLAHTVDVAIHVQELGQQRASLVGGRGQFGSTMGVAYTLFNLFHGEELLSSKVEGGPETLQLALGLAKEGVLGSRGSLALSVFNMFLRPHLTGPVKGPFFRQQSVGLNADWSYALSQVDSFNFDYGLSCSTTSYSLALPPSVIGLPPVSVAAKTSSHWVGAGWTRDTGNEHITLADSVSGGWLGGSESLLRSKSEYSRIFHDVIFDRQNAWAFRSTLSGVGSYFGEMPPTSRWFSGDEFVRGLRAGELGPYAAVSPTLPSGASQYTAVPAGANLIGAMNVEYRMRLGGGAEAAAFFDSGSGWLLPNWLGNARPSLIDSTKKVLHGSTGIELRWTLPGVGVPLRSYYALNVLRLHRSLLMPDGSLFRPQNRLFGFGWGLGTLF
jgi:outer membrane protein assembly complex protein YaeT